MTFRVVMSVRNPAGSPEPARTLTTNIAGCADANEARQKARRFFDVVAFKSVEEKQESARGA